MTEVTNATPNNNTTQSPFTTSDAFDRLAFELNTDEWWQELLGSRRVQKFDPSQIDLFEVEERLPRSDRFTAEEIYMKFHNRVTYVSGAKEWHLWDGSIHRVYEGEDLAHQLVSTYASELRRALEEIKAVVSSRAHTKAITETSADDAPAAVEEALKAYNKTFSDHRRYRNNLNSTAGIKNVIEQLRMQFAVPSTYFDNDRNLVVFADGQVLDTNNPKTELKKADPSRPVTRKMGVTLGEGSPVKLLRAFTDWEIPADQQQYLKIAAGAALLGRGDAKNIVALVGVSNTGKSSFIRTLLKAFGSYGSILPPGAIVAKTSTNFEQHKARGARFLYLEEPYEARTDDSFLKNLAGGGGEVATQRKNRDVVEWIPQCVLFIGANHVPKINTQDDAIVKRMNIVGFNRVFSTDGGIFHKDIESYLIAEEGPQIARWILEGAIEYDRLGSIPVPKSIKDNAAANVTKASISLRWLEEKFELKELVNVKGRNVAHRNMASESKELYNAFKLWCIEVGEKEPSKNQWASEINRSQGQPVTLDGNRPGGSKRLWAVMAPDAMKDLPGLPQITAFTVSNGHATMN